MTNIPLLLAQIAHHDVFTVEFWRAVYATGRLGNDLLPPLLVIIVARLVVVGCIILAARIVAGIMRRVIHRAFTAMASRSARDTRRLSTLESLIASSLSYLVYIIALIPVLFTLGFTWTTLAALFATSSVVLVAIGLGSQKLVRDLVNGLFILGEGQFDVDDWVTIGGVTGRVEEIGLRITRLRDEQGRQFIIANGDINQVFNASRGAVKLVIDMALQRTPALDISLQTMRETAGAVLAAHGIEPGEHTITLALTGMDAAKVTVRLTLWASQRHLAAIEHEVRRRLLQAQETEALALV